MKVLGKTSVLLYNEQIKKKYWSGEVEVRLWETGDPFPKLGTSVGIDTETELITDAVKDPPLVVYGCFDPASSICWIAYWDEALPLMQYVSTTSTHQYFFNVGFDELVIDNEDPDERLIRAVDAGRVRDMQIRYHLWLIATAGDIPKTGHGKLGEIAKRMLGVELDKGEKDDPNSHRLTFRRFNEDGSKYRMTDKQAVYLAWDCIATWGISQAVPEQPTEVQHTKGMIVLAHIARNGLQIDPFVFDAIERQLVENMEEARERLMSFGFPDPEKRNDSTEPQENLFRDSLREFCKVSGQQDITGYCTASKGRMRFLLTFAYNYRNSPEDADELAQVVTYTLSERTPEKKMNLTKDIKTVWNEVLDKYDLLAFDGNKRKVVPVAYMGAFLEDIVRQWKAPEFSTSGVNFDSAIEHAGQYMDDHPWLTESKTDKIGPKKFFQDHVADIMAQYPDLELPLTKKAKQVKLAKDDMWRLKDLGIEDDFLTAYTEYGHLRKYKSTYINREYTASDGRVHPYFKNVMRTGRTSASAPNVQNYPSRDKVWALKNIFAPYPDTVLCATDFSFVELCGFAQTCYTRFGKSTMRDIINAGIDPHRWFAGVMKKLITTDLREKDNPEWVAELNKFLKENVPDSVRQLAKAANFGFPGALGAKRFYLNSRAQGLEMTMDDAYEMREEWIRAFPEMRKHMNPEKARDTGLLNRNLFGFHGNWHPLTDEEEEFDEDDYEEMANGKDDSFAYCAVLPCGQVRNCCSYNAACNFQFQGTVAVGAKAAGWNLVKNGYGERLYNFVHDEYLYCLYPDELKVHVPIIEKLMIQGMKTVIPDVNVKVETTCMLHWDKKATEFVKLEWNPDGTPIIEEPPYVRKLYNQETS
jgi:DNA polymerase I-like protein with 3'-5' exonuclease and polymerase domains